ncbi:MAG: Trm112 family protein [Streptosporangiales bacterium]|nr:Trm112 family protein [Streptosporangiales bacterium]
MTLDPWLLEVLACPACKASLRPVSDADELACTSDACGLVYPIRDDVPVLLVEEARKP